MFKRSSVRAALLLAAANPFWLGGCSIEDDVGPDDTDAIAEDHDVAPAPSSWCDLPGGAEIVDGNVVVEGDMIYATLAEYEAVCSGDGDVATRSQELGVGIDDPFKRWPGGVVPYEIDSRLIDQFRVHDAIADWESKTPIRFRRARAGEDYVRFTYGSRCSSKVGRVGGRQDIVISSGDSARDIVGQAIKSDGRVYTWFGNSQMSVGGSSDLDDRRAAQTYTLPPGYSARDIVGVAIDKNDHVYAFYDDGKYSIGDSLDLDSRQSPRTYLLPPGETTATILGMDFGRYNNELFVWYRTGYSSNPRHSVGTPSNLASKRYAVQSYLPGGLNDDDIVGVAIKKSNGYVYTFLRDSNPGVGTVVVGDQTRLGDERGPEEFRTAGYCSTSSVIHEIGHAVGLKHEQSRCDRNSHVDIFWDNIISSKKDNFDRECVGYTDYGSYNFRSIMHYHSYAFSKTGTPTILRKARTYSGIGGAVAQAVKKSNNYVYTWWSDGHVTVGTSSALESRRSREPFVLPGSYRPRDIVGIAISANDKVYAYYRDGRYSIGTSTDLGELQGPRTFSQARGYSASDIIGMGATTDNRFYAFYRNQRVTVGTYNDLDRHRSPRSYTPASGQTVSNVVGMAISNRNEVHSWYSVGFGSVGSSSDLDSRRRFGVAGLGQTINRDASLSPGDVSTINSMY